MKKIILFCAIIAIAFVACDKKSDETPVDPILGCMDPNSLTYNAEATEDDGSCEYIEQANKALYLHFTEDWCGPCGKYGGPTFDSCVKKLEGGNVNCMKVYGGSNNNSLENSFATTMKSATNYNITSIPTMYVNAATSGVYSNVNTNYNWVKNQAATFASQTVLAGVHLSKSIDGSNMSCKATVKFFNAIPAGKDYRLSIYVMEDNVIANQTVSGITGGVPNYVHRNVWRASNGTNFKGIVLNSSEAIAANQQFVQTANIPLLTTWNQANLKAIAVIWEVPASGLPKVVNSTKAK